MKFVGMLTKQLYPGQLNPANLLSRRVSAPSPSCVEFKAVHSLNLLATNSSRSIDAEQLQKFKIHKYNILQEVNHALLL